MKILLMGNPNVGKSVIFSRLTGVNVIASNYHGTTVEFTRGTMRFRQKKAEIIDVPGTYSLSPTTKAEEVASEMLKEGDIVINVIDATNLERSLNFTLELIESGAKIIVALNIWDEACHKGIKIDADKLEKMLGVPVVPTCALTGEGIKELVDGLTKAKARRVKFKDKWAEIGKIIENVQKVTRRHHTPLEKLENASVIPITGIPIAFVVLFLSFWLIRIIGESLIGYVLDPLFENIWTPLIMRISNLLHDGGFLHDLLIGQLIGGEIVYMESMGLLTTGLFVPIAAVLPYIFSFYLVLSLLEDFGYLPRLAVLTDTVMHRVGLHGMGIIPMMLGLGCNVPGALSTRILETRRERFIAMTLLAISVPCMAQIAMVVGLMGKYGIRGLGTVFFILSLIWLVLGLILNKLVKGESPEIFVDIAPYRLPHFKAIGKKVWMRVKWFLKGAFPFVLLGVIFVNLLYTFGIIHWIGKYTAPMVTNLFGLPEDAVSALIVGFLRKDVAVGMLVPLNLSLKQLIIASVILAMYFPCVATFAAMLRELGIWDMLKSVGIMLLATTLVGSLLNLIL
jgi:ferrous iron transport protein B